MWNLPAGPAGPVRPGEPLSPLSPGGPGLPIPTRPMSPLYPRRPVSIWGGGMQGLSKNVLSEMRYRLVADEVSHGKLYSGYYSIVSA